MLFRFIKRNTVTFINAIPFANNLFIIPITNIGILDYSYVVAKNPILYG